MRLPRTALLAAIIVSAPVWANGSKVLATGGATTIEGTAGGGIVPWAVINGYASTSQWSMNAGYNSVAVDDFSLASRFVSFSFDNQVELSYVHQRFSLDRFGGDLRQQIFGVKYKIAGDLLYSAIPQFSAGLLYKQQLNFALPKAVGARKDEDLEFYWAASKLYLDAIAGRNLLLNYTLRGTRAHQTGLLGFASADDGAYQWVSEASAVLMLNPQWALGVEYKQKPSTLGFAKEQDWKDIFSAYFINKHVSLVAGYVDLGDIATLPSQQGYYLALEGSWAF